MKSLAITFFFLPVLGFSENFSQWTDSLTGVPFAYIGIMSHGCDASDRSALAACRSLGIGWDLPSEALLREGESLGNPLVVRLFQSSLSPDLVVSFGSPMKAMWLKKSGGFPIGHAPAFVQFQGSLRIERKNFPGCSRPALPVICFYRPFE